jgi:aspartyl-tRNA(Asn)/glutamyl-tRNA(Gln) amidotransferase subunit C
MNEVDTSDVQPMAHPMDVAQRLRTDVILEENQRETFQKIAPKTENGLYLVPKVIE